MGRAKLLTILEGGFMKDIYLAGGCFWGVEEYFSRIDGIVESEVGYANGNEENPSYERVCTGITGFVEAVKLTYDERLIGLEGILKVFFHIIDPTMLNRQGPDLGTQYRTGIYYLGDEEEEIKAYIRSIEANYTRPIVTEVLRLKNYYPAEDYHQDYLKKNPNGYCHIDLSK